MEYYRALYKYIPKEIDDTEDVDQIPDIPLDKDDILEVKLPISDDIQKPKGWLIGYNKNQKLCGYFPGPYVEHITPQMVQMAPQIGEWPTQLCSDHYVVKIAVDISSWNNVRWLSWINIK